MSDFLISPKICLAWLCLYVQLYAYGIRPMAKWHLDILDAEIFGGKIGIKDFLGFGCTNFDNFGAFYGIKMKHKHYHTLALPVGVFCQSLFLFWSRYCSYWVHGSLQNLKCSHLFWVPRGKTLPLISGGNLMLVSGGISKSDKNFVYYICWLRNFENVFLSTFKNDKANKLLVILTLKNKL